MTHLPDASITHSVAQFAAAESRQRILFLGYDGLTQQPTIDYLEREGYEVRAFPIEEASLPAMTSFVPDVIVVNVQQPGDDWLRAVRTVRETSTAPILILSPQGDATDRLVGVDVHLSKPLQRSELLQRIETLMRGHAVAENAATSEAAELPLEGDLRFEDLVVRPRMRVVERDGVAIDLSATEFDLLYFLASHARQVFTRQQLLDWVWHYGYFGDSRTVTVHMSRLRKKVEPDPANPRHLRTVWGVGYKFMP
jgi:DNA-binding response OmpR family regulator